jgi:acyl-CoA thioesterase-1
MLVDHDANWEALRGKDPRLFQKYVPDGIHPSPEGCREVITPALLAALGVPATTVAGAAPE